MATGCSATAWPGCLDSMLSEKPSSGCTRRTSTLGCRPPPAAASRNSSTGGRLKWMAISVTRRARRLPVRR